MSIRPGTRRGSSLIEATFGGFLLSVLVCLLGTLFMSSNQAMKRSRWKSLATRECYGQFERLRASAYADLEAQIPGGSARGDESFQPTTELPNASGRLSYRKVRLAGNTLVTWTSGGGAADGIEVTAAVTWINPTRQHRIEHESLVTVIVPRPKRFLGII